MTDKDQAMAWFDAEMAVLLALIGYADAMGSRPTPGSSPGPPAVLPRRGRWLNYAAAQGVALAAARAAG